MSASAHGKLPRACPAAANVVEVIRLIRFPSSTSLTTAAPEPWPERPAAAGLVWPPLSNPWAMRSALLVIRPSTQLDRNAKLEPVAGQGDPPCRCDGNVPSACSASPGGPGRSKSGSRGCAVQVETNAAAGRRWRPAVRFRGPGSDSRSPGSSRAQAAGNQGTAQCCCTASAAGHERREHDHGSWRLQQFRPPAPGLRAIVLGPIWRRR